MNSSHTSSRRFLWIFVFSFFLLSVSVYAAIFYLPWSNNSWGQIEEKVENGFAVTQGTSKEINVWGECKKVTAGSSMNVYVPTKTQNEWNQFKAHAGNIGASIAACACVPNGSCSAAAPACGTTTTGTDNCGGSCSKTGPACACVPNGSCSASAPACGTTTTGTDNCGGSCSKTGPACACVPNGSCSAAAPACGTTTTGTDNCGGSCSKTGPACAIPVNGVCSTTPFSCSAGILDPTLNEATPKGSYPRGCYYDWSCNGSNGGTQKWCAKTVGCFAPDELVKTLHGEIKISELKVWDKIISYDEIQNKFIENIIDKIIIHDGISSPLNDFEKYPLLSLVVETGGKKKTTKVTSNHLYFSPESWKYKHIGEFVIGEKVQSIDGIGFIISKTKLNLQPTVYNLHMKNSPNNYLVNGVVVHNEKAEACTGCIGPTCNAISAWLLMN